MIADPVSEATESSNKWMLISYADRLRFQIISLSVNFQAQQSATVSQILLLRRLRATWDLRSYADSTLDNTVLGHINAHNEELCF